MKLAKRAGLGVKPALLEEPGSQVGRPCPKGWPLQGKTLDHTRFLVSVKNRSFSHTLMIFLTPQASESCFIQAKKNLLFFKIKKIGDTP
jgi:hypothetical protein